MSTFHFEIVGYVSATGLSQYNGPHVARLDDDVAEAC